jgi:hypothetical protein
MKGSHHKLIIGGNNIRQKFLKYLNNRIMKNQITRKILAVLITAVFILLFTPLISSCLREPDFGDLTICGEIDMATFAPLEIKNSFDIGVEKIIATIKVSGTRAEDTWRFIWINEDTGDVIADSTNNYSKEGSRYMEGYLSNYIVPGQEGGIIGEPGSYRVNFYHNSQFINSASFIIEYPELEITGVVLSREIDESGQPADTTENFYQDDIIYTLLSLNCKIKDETCGIKWYRGEDELLGEKEFTIEKDYYMPDYIVFTITNDELWPIGSYRIEIFRNGLPDSEYYFEVVEKEVADATFSSGNTYRSEEYKFSILYPDGWDSKEDVGSTGLKTDFIPASSDINVAIHMRVLEEGYFPSEEDYSDFSDEVLSDVIAMGGTGEIKKSESTGKVSDIIYRQINYHYPGEDGDGWDVDLIFINRSSMLYLLINVSDTYYQEFADKVYKKMLYSLSFD